MAEQRTQHEQERTRLQQQHKAEKDSMVQEHQQEVSSLEKQARAALHQHQQHTQEWRKRDAKVGGLHWSTFTYTHTHTLIYRSPVDNHFLFCLLTSWGFKSAAGWDTFYLKQDFRWRVWIILETVVHQCKNTEDPGGCYFNNVTFYVVARGKKVLEKWIIEQIKPKTPLTPLLALFKSYFIYNLFVFWVFFFSFFFLFNHGKVLWLKLTDLKSRSHK